MLNDSLKDSTKNSDNLDLARVLADLKSMSWIHVGEKGKILESNPAVQNLLGYTSRELKAISFQSLFSSSDRTEELPEAQSILAASQEEYMAWAHLKHKSGALLSVSLVYKRLKRKNGKEVKDPFSYPMMVLIFALPRQADLERLLGEYQGKVENHAMERHLSLKALSHQLRSPLTVMSLSINLLRDYSEKMSATERLEEIHQIEEGINSCQAFLEQALAEARSKIADTPRQIDPLFK